VVAYEGEQVVELLVAAVGLDVHPDADAPVARGHAGIEAEEALEVEVALEPGGEATDLDAIARHASPGEALRIAKVYLLKLHVEGQLPYRPLLHSPTADAAVRAAQAYLEGHFRDPHVIMHAVEHTGLPERTLKRRFKVATGTTLIACLQTTRIEAAKRLLEASGTPVEEVSFEVGYEDPSFFRRLFKRVVGLTPSAYRRMFGGVGGWTETDGSRVLA
jgi:AraC-like DNA-binding protein